MGNVAASVSLQCVPGAEESESLSAGPCVRAGGRGEQGGAAQPHDTSNTSLLPICCEGARRNRPRACRGPLTMQALSAASGLSLGAFRGERRGSEQLLRVRHVRRAAVTAPRGPMNALMEPQPMTADGSVRNFASLHSRSREPRRGCPRQPAANGSEVCLCGQPRRGDLLVGGAERP